jgi:2-polyprenyl-3-methyl-5-hydroxy-6-metoxy-1,4-benzoquinol methylase
MKSNKHVTSLKAESEAFDKRINERIENGLIPDLRRVINNDWFYNNPWRRPEYVDMVFGDYFRFALKHIPPKSSILEIGSGLGHMTLEFARNGHNVVGIELSAASVSVANTMLSENPFDQNFGSLDYINIDFLSWETVKKFDVVCIFLALHHFENPEIVVQKITSLLNDKGKIIVIEPARDFFSARNASIVTLIRSLLSISGNWYKPFDIPENITEFEALTKEFHTEYQDAQDKNEEKQSPHDNHCFAKDMIDSLDKYFHCCELSYGNTITPRMLGGIRCELDEKAIKIAKLIKTFDDFATQAGHIEPGVFYYSGEFKDKNCNI